MTEPTVLIVSRDADEFASEVAAGNASIPLVSCSDAAAALKACTDQRILFGDPAPVAEILPRMPSVEWVQSTWTGVTPLIDLDKRDYQLTAVKGIFGPQMAEYVFGYLLSRELNIDERASHQRKHQWRASGSRTLFGKRIGIMGTGTIGQALAQQARYFGMNVVGLSRSGAPGECFEHVYPAAGIDDFLAGLDYLVSVLPDTPDTCNLLNARTLRQLLPHAVFVNVGRANVVDDDALIAALRNGELAGAVLDVFDVEPVPADSPLWDTPNLTMTPHIAAISHPSLIVPIFLDNYRRFVAGESLLYQVDFEHGY